MENSLCALFSPYLLFSIPLGGLLTPSLFFSYLLDIIAFFIVSAAFLLAFAGWEHVLVHSPRFSLPPLLPLEIFRRGRVLLVMVVGLTTWAAFQPLLLYIVCQYKDASISRHPRFVEALTPILFSLQSITNNIWNSLLCRPWLGCFQVLSGKHAFFLRRLFVSALRLDLRAHPRRFILSAVCFATLPLL